MSVAVSRIEKTEERLTLCQEDVGNRPYSHPVTTGWYAEDVAALLTQRAVLRNALMQIEAMPIRNQVGNKLAENPAITRDVAVAALRETA